MIQPNKQSANLPALRFPEFQEDWETKELRSISKISSGGTPSRQNRTFWKGDIPWITTAEIDYNTIFNTNEKITFEGLNGSSAKMFPKDTILMAMYGQGKTRGKVAKLGIAASTNQACAAIILEKSYYPNFYFLYLQSQYNKIRQISNAGGQKNLSAELVKKLMIPITSLPEQKRIADCLSSLDDLITSENNKLEALKAHKKGLMQNLFPQAGETTPRLRFPEFQGDGEWEEKKLGDVANIIAGQSPQGDSYNDVKIGTPFFQGKTDFGEIFLNKPSKWTTEITKKAIPGDILMSVRAPVGALNISNLQICIGRGLASIRVKENKWFIYYYLLKNRKNIIGNGGSIFDSINKKQIENLLILTPSLTEQQRIADCLSSLDDLITAQSAKIAHLKTHKKGMMQQLFPRLDQGAS